VVVLECGWWWFVVIVLEAYRVARVDEALNIDDDRLLLTRTIGHVDDGRFGIA
jgi:hypothetical protein